MKLFKILFAALIAYVPTAWSAVDYNIKYSSNYVMPAYVHFKADGSQYSVNAKINIPLYNIVFTSRGSQTASQFKMVNYQDVRNGKPYAKRSVAIFHIAILVVMLYATAISKTVGLIQNPILSRDNAIISFMLATAAIITMACKVDTAKITNAATFKSGMSAVICVLGVAWLGNTFVEGHIDQIKAVSAEFLQQYPWSLAVILFFASTLLYSQAATAKALYPTAILLGVSPEAAIAAFAAVSALFILPTYPTLIAAVEMDDTGSTRIGKYVFNHPFLVPGVIAISLSVLFGFLMAGAVL